MHYNYTAWCPQCVWLWFEAIGLSPRRETWFCPKIVTALLMMRIMKIMNSWHLDTWRSGSVLSSEWHVTSKFELSMHHACIEKCKTVHICMRWHEKMKRGVCWCYYLTHLGSNIDVNILTIMFYICIWWYHVPCTCIIVSVSRQYENFFDRKEFTYYLQALVNC